MKSKPDNLLRFKRQQAKKSAAEFKKVIKKMDQYLGSKSEHAIELASAFYQIIMHHMEFGDLMAHNINLAAYLRKNNEQS